jgi:hypothetical protein
MWSEAEKTWSGAFPNTPIIGKIIATAKDNSPLPNIMGVFGTAPQTPPWSSLKLKFVKHLFSCPHNSTLFPQTEYVELKPFG